MARMTEDQLRSLQEMAKRLPPPSNQKSNFIAGREGQERVGSGVLGTLFSAMDRPRAAIAGGIYNTLDDDEKTDFFGGLVSGLKGQQHISGSKILEELGVKNNVLKGVGGFVADVGLDPLTYIGAKRVKGIGREAAEKEALQMATKEGSVHNLDSIQALTSQIMDAHPSKLELQVGLPGRKKPIAAIERGEGELRLRGNKGTVLAGSRTGSVALDTIMNTAIGRPGEKPRVLARGLSRSVEEPYGIAQINMQNEAIATALHDQHYATRKELYAALDDEEQALVAKAYEDGTDLSDVPLANQNHPSVKKYGLTSLQDYIHAARGEKEKMFKMQQEAGIIPADAEFNPNSLTKVILHADRYSTKPHVLAGGAAGQAYDELKNKTWDELDEIEARQKAAGKQGIGVVKHLGASINADMEQSYRQMGRANSNKTVFDTLGMDAEPGSDLEKYFQKGESPIGWVKVDPINNPFGGVQNPLARTDRYKNTWIPRDVARVLNFSEKALTDHSTGSELAQTWQKIQGHWKGLVVASPGYFSRNSMGDVIMNAADGVRGIKPYERARTILHDVKQNEAQDVYAAMRDPTLPMGQVIPRSIPGSTHVLGAGKNQVRLSSQDINQRFIEEGGASGVIQTERIGLPDEVTRNKAFEHAQRVGTQTSGTLNKVEATMADLNNKREKYFRMAHFTDKWDKYLKQGMTDEAASKAAMNDVRKFNIDYRNLSSFERNTVRKVIPFYSWFRRNSQLQMEMLFTKPGFMALYPKTTTAVQNMLGTDEGNGDWMLPKWIRESYPVRVVAGDAQQNSLTKMLRFAAGAGTGEAVMAPLASGMTPLADLGTVLSPVQAAWDKKSPWAGFTTGAREAANMTSPLIRGVYEGATQKSIYSGNKITDWNKWALSQTGVPGRTAEMIKEGQPNMSAIMSMATGLQLKPVTQQYQLSEYKRREDILRKQVTGQQKKIAKKAGWDWNNLTDAAKEGIGSNEIFALKNYLKWAGRSVGANQ